MKGKQPVIDKDGVIVFFFFFQAEDGIRDYKVTGVQTCALLLEIWQQQLCIYASSEKLVIRRGLID